jgi:hypothetical protein
MMVGAMAEGATSAHALPARSVALEMQWGSTGGPGWSGGSGVGDLRRAFAFSDIYMS